LLIQTDPIRDFVERIDVRTDAIEIRLLANAARPDRSEPIVVVWTKPTTRVQRDVIAPATGQWADPRAMSSDTRSRLLSAIALSRRWLEDLATGRIENIDALAARGGRCARSVSMLLSLAFLAPHLVKTIVDHRMPRGIGLAQLVNLPMEWGRQEQALGFSA
jgi:site-specific DNA recombinase